MLKIYFLSLCLVVSHCMHAQTTYAWNLAGGGDWQSASNWSSVPGGLPRTVPAADDILVFTTVSGSITNVPTQTIGQLTINSSTVDLVAAPGGVTLTVTGTVTVNAGSLLAFNATLAANSAVTIDGSYQINQGGWATGSGTWTYGAAGTLIFNNSSGSYGVDNSHVYWPSVNGPVNVTVAGAGGITMNAGAIRTVAGLFQTAAAITSGNNLTLNGTCQINTGGYFTAGSPIYGSSSLLKYNTGGTYNRVGEWDYIGVGTVGVDPGYPNDVQLSNNTTLNLPNTSNLDRGCARDLIIDAGSNLYANFSGGSVKLFVGRDFTMSGNVTLGSSIGGDLYVKRNFTRNAGTFDPNNRTVIFDGPTGNQAITGTTTFDYLILDKAAGNLVLNSPITCTQLLTLTKGKIVTTATNLLTLIDNASYAGGSVNSFVEGPMKKIGEEGFVFPIGKGGIYAPLGLLNVSGENPTDEFTAEYIRNNPQSLRGPNVQTSPLMDHVSYVEYWQLNHTGAAVKKVSLKVNTTSFCKKLDNTYVSRWNGSFWTYEGSTNGGITSIPPYETGTITSVNSLSAYGEISFITDLSFLLNPLPVKLISFNALKVNDRQNRVIWTLADYCSDEVRFEIQASEDNGGFRTIFTVPGSVSSRTYSYSDNRQRRSDVYYRLKITEPSGKITYSAVAAILQNSNDLLITQLWPNPVTDKAHLSISSGSTTKGRLLLLNMAGQVVLEQSIALAEGSRIIELDLSHLPAGIYQGRVQAGLRNAGFRLVKK